MSLHILLSIIRPVALVDVQERDWAAMLYKCARENHSEWIRFAVRGKCYITDMDPNEYWFNSTSFLASARLSTAVN